MARIAWLMVRIVLGGVLIFAAYSKLRQPWLLFAMSIDSYQILPEWAVLSVARTLPWLELVLGVLLVFGVWPRYITALTAALFTLFFAAMIAAYSRGLGIDCGCFGVGEALSPKTLTRDGLLVAGAIALAVVS